MASPNSDEPETSCVVQVLKEALKCPSNGLRKGLSTILVEFISIVGCSIHQGRARVYLLKNQLKEACEEMTKLIEKACSKGATCEKRSEYYEREKAKEDLDIADSVCASILLSPLTRAL